MLLPLVQNILLGWKLKKVTNTSVVNHFKTVFAELNKLGRLPLKGDTLMELRAGGLRPYLQANTRFTYTLVLLPVNKSVLKLAGKDRLFTPHCKK